MGAIWRPNDRACRSEETSGK